VAPIETSANGVLVVEEVGEYNIKNLELRFEKGKIVSFKAEKGGNVFTAHISLFDLRNP
jgi:leucyl aminopeptidase (aminopeptidase T)